MSSSIGWWTSQARSGFGALTWIKRRYAEDLTTFFYGKHLKYLIAIPGTSGICLSSVLSSTTFKLKRTLEVMMLVAQAADSSRLSPSCFFDLIVHRAVLPLILVPSMMKPEP